MRRLQPLQRNARSATAVVFGETESFPGGASGDIGTAGVAGAAGDAEAAGCSQAVRGVVCFRGLIIGGRNEGRKDGPAQIEDSLRSGTSRGRASNQGRPRSVNRSDSVYEWLRR